MKYRILSVLPFILLGCAFSKPGSDQVQVFGQSEYGLTVDWLLTGQTQPDPTLKAVRLLNQNGETYVADLPVTLPASVPQSLILMGEFSQSQINQEIDFLRAVIRFGEKIVYVPAQLVAEEPSDRKRRLTFQVTGLNAAFRTEKSGQGRLQIEIFGRSQRLGILEAAVRTPPSEVKYEEIQIKTWESNQAQGDVSEYLKPIIAGRQMNLLRVLRFNNSENLPVQIQTPRRPKGTLVQWTNRISYSQAQCSYSRSDNVTDDILGDDILIVPLDDRFITEAERLVRAPEIVGDISTVIYPSSAAIFGVYALGEGADRWMNNGPLRSELSIVSATASCGRRCSRRTCEPTPGRDHFASTASDFALFGCYCEEYEQTYNRVNISVGTDRRAVGLSLPKSATVTSIRFSDLDPHKDGEVRLVPTLTEKSEVQWF